MNVTFYVRPEFSIEDAWEELEDQGLELFYSIEDPEKGKEIIGSLGWKQSLESLLKTLKTIRLIAPCQIEPINWMDQWASFGPGYREGFIHLDLCKEGFFPFPPWEDLRLQPGPGFGDFSHPTTRLVMKLMAEHLKNKYVLDIGCGSGILSLAAIAFGAKKVWGIDIDPEALFHAELNAEFNKMQDLASFCRAEEFSKPLDAGELTVLMNMITSEQRLAWLSLASIHPFVKECFTSGVLAEEKQAYLAEAFSWGLKLNAEAEEDGWLAFHLVR